METPSVTFSTYDTTIVPIGYNHRILIFNIFKYWNYIIKKLFEFSFSSVFFSHELKICKGK